MTRVSCSFECATLCSDTPQRPLNVSERNITSRSFILEWVEPHDSNAPILGYLVRYNMPFFLNSTMVIQEVTEAELTITGLHPGVTYNLTVVAFNEIGDSLPSDVAQVRTADKGDSY